MSLHDVAIQILTSLLGDTTGFLIAFFLDFLMGVGDFLRFLEVFGMSPGLVLSSFLF